MPQVNHAVAGYRASEPRSGGVSRRRGARNSRGYDAQEAGTLVDERLISLL
jgi:hypothetical protein